MPFMSAGKFVFELKGNYFGMVGTFVYKKYKYCTYLFVSQGPEIFMLGSGGKNILDMAHPTT
jgi:hypothetical protein